MDQGLRREFAQWLSSETWRWTTYGTLTFSRPMLKDALRFSRAWVKFIARTAQSVRGFCFQETHSDGLRLHVHCLLSIQRNLLKQPSNKEMWHWWFQKFGRAVVTDFCGTPPNTKSTSQSVSSQAEIFSQLANYLTKYVVKEASQGGFDWDFYHFAGGFELDFGDTMRYRDGMASNVRLWRPKTHGIL